MTKIVIAGTAGLAMPDLSLPATVVSSILAIVAMLPEDAEVAVRGPKALDGFASTLEEWAYRITAATGRDPRVYRPVEGNGRQSVYMRDYDLVDMSEHVYAYFAPDHIMEGGTGHVVKAALDRHIPVEAWTINDEGQLVLVGSDDGHPPASPEELADIWNEANGEPRTL
jgi:hypothetical protein